uniref:Ribonuclease H protein At1g65750 family n=1 Tax=Cajanus cajan TaxID=3821 RepID=A0A151RQB1_CAJCA|nr:Putative ribonuclease H protein At1g65750 family [Cajanus cajan]
MQMVHLPRKVCDDIDHICRSILWGDFDDRKNIHVVVWDEICRPKEKRGLGLRKMRDVNDTFMMKNCWSILTQPQKLWVKVVYRMASEADQTETRVPEYWIR